MAFLWACYWNWRARGAGRYQLPPPHVARDPVLLRLAGLACLFFISAILGGVQLGVASAIAAGVLVAAFAVRRRSALRWGLIPWRLPVFVTGLMLVVQTISIHFLGSVVSAMIGLSGGAVGTFRAAAVGAGLSNVLNNLPAYLAGEAVVPAANHVQLLGLLIGTNVGPIITPWASLATLLWYERCRAQGVRVPLRAFMLTGAGLAIAGTAAAVGALLVTNS
jgi:arsenical pump membrane protein